MLINTQYALALILSFAKSTIIIGEREITNGITKSLNTIITNLSSRVLSNDEYFALRFSLNHGLATRPDEF